MPRYPAWVRSPDHTHILGVMTARFVLALVVVFALVACVPPEGGIDEDDVAGYWLLEEGSVRDEPLTPVPGYRIALRLDADGTLGGTGGCNSFGGTYDLVGGVYEMGAELTMTAIACGEDVMAAEDRFVQGLRLIETAELNDDGLLLTGEDTRLEFSAVEPLDPAALEGRWNVVAVGLPGSEITAEGGAFVVFDAGGAMEGNTGCRTLTGRFQVSGDEVLMTELAAEGECEAGLADQDGLVVEVLGDGFTADFSGMDAVRLDSRGGPYLLLERA